MSFKSESQVLTLIQKIVKLYFHVSDFRNGDFETDCNDVSQAIDSGDDTDEDIVTATALENVKQNFNGLYTGLVQLFQTVSGHVGRLSSSPNLADFNMCWDYFFQYMVDNSETVQDKVFKESGVLTVEAGGAGTGKAYLFDTDIDGRKIDIGKFEDMTVKCTKDISQGATAGREQFTVLGEKTGDNPFLEGGSGSGSGYDYAYGIVDADFGSDMPRVNTGGFISVASGASGGSGASGQTGNVLRNGNFENSLSNWSTISGSPTVQTDSPINGLGSLMADADFVLVQYLDSNRLKPRIPYAMSCKIMVVNDDTDNGTNPGGTVTGTLTIKIKNEDDSVTHATLTVDVSTLTPLYPDDATRYIIDPIGFYIPNDAEDLKIEIELDNLGGTATIKEVHIDDVVVQPATYVNGYALAIFDGTTVDGNGYAQGRFRNGDKFIISTTAGTANEGLIQDLVNRAVGRYLPSSDAPTYVDPTL